MKLRSTDVVLLWPDGHHEFLIVPHTDKWPPPTIMVPLPATRSFSDSGIVPEQFVVPERLYFHRLGKIKTSVCVFIYKRKQCLWAYCQLINDTPLVSLSFDAIMDLADDFFAAKRKQHA